MVRTWIEWIEGINNFKTDFFSFHLLNGYGDLGLSYKVPYFIYWTLSLFLIFMTGAMLCGYLQCRFYRLDKAVRNSPLRSFCDYCGKTLKGLDPISFLNFILLKGRCRYCGTALPVKYFLSEILSGLTFLGIVLSPAPLYFSLPLALFMVHAASYTLYFQRLNPSALLFLLLLGGAKILMTGYRISIPVAITVILISIILLFIKSDGKASFYFLFLLLLASTVPFHWTAIGLLSALLFSAVLGTIQWRFKQRSPSFRIGIDPATLFFVTFCLGASPGALFIR